MSGLPSGWIVAPLGEVADVQLGKMLDRKRTEGTSLPYLRNVNVRWGHIDVSDLLEMPFRDHELGRYAVKPGDVMVCEGGEPGRAAVWTRHDEGIKYQKALHRVRVGAGLLPNWLVYQLHLDASNGRLAKQFTGTTIGHLPREAIVEYRLRLAPLPEQRRIVEVIESYFTRLDDAVATLERVQQNLKRYRASVLRAAVEGRLVPTEAELARAEGRDYEPASALLERILAERRRRWHEAGARGKYHGPVAPDTADLPELPEGWCWATMDHFVYTIEAGKNFRCIEIPPGPSDVGVVKVSAVTWESFDEDESKTCPRSELVNETHFISPGDFLISRANTIKLVGACVIVNTIQRRLMLSDKILRLQTVGGLDWWLLWVLRSVLGRREIESLATGNQESMRNIGQAGIRRIRIPVPPEAECRRIISEIERQTSVFEHSMSVIWQSEERCWRLRQSILKWAFEGRLADQDPSDEPASALLERIRSETSASRQTASNSRVSRIVSIQKRRRAPSGRQTR